MQESSATSSGEEPLGMLSILTPILSFSDESHKFQLLLCLWRPTHPPSSPPKEKGENLLHGKNEERSKINLSLETVQMVTAKTEMYQERVHC